MENRVFGALLAALFGCAHLPVVQSAQLRILYAEPFRPQSSDVAASQKAAPGSLRVQAFGRSFELALQDNSGLLRAAPAHTRRKLESTRLFKGTVKDAPGSWVRLTLAGGNYSGAIWDGSELYAIEPRGTLDPLLLVPIPGASTGSAIYRLSDTQGGSMQKSCGVDAGASARSGPLAKYRSLIRELRSASDTAFATAPREIEVAMVADFEFTALRGAASVSTMIERMNVVDGIFGGQVGVAIVPTDFITFASDTDQFTSREASTLLDQFAGYRSSTPDVRSRGLAHLLTGRDLNGNVAGIAYIGSLCAAREGVALSESSVTIDSALIIAHELGHNFGAPHDGETGSACATTPQSYVMAPFLSGSSTFSACSLQRMQPYIAGASCVIAGRNRDVGLSVPSDTIQAVIDQPFDFVADVTSTGDTAAANVIVSVGLPFSTLPLSASMPGATCSIQADSVNCALPELAAAETRRLTVNLRPRSAGEFNMIARVSASNDGNDANNSRSVRVRVAGERDVHVTAAPQPLSVTRGEPFEMTFDIAAAGTQTLNDVRAEIIHSSITATSASVDNGTCSTAVTQPIVTCMLGSIALGAPRRLRVQMVSTGVGDSMGSIRVHEQAHTAGQRLIYFKVGTRATRDISLSTSPLFRRVAVGVDAAWSLEVRSDGVQDVNDVHIRLSTPALVHLSIDGPLAASCVPAGRAIDCNLGTMPAGSVRTLQFRARADVETSTSVDAEVVLPTPDDVGPNDRVHLSLDVRVASEVRLQAPAVANLYDGRTAFLVATVAAAGANASDDVRVSVSLPQGFSFQSGQLQQAQCVVQPGASNMASCSMPRLNAGDHAVLQVAYVAPEPGVYNGSIAVAASDDTDPENNSQAIAFNVAPSVDGGLSASGVLRAQPGVPVDLMVTVTTNRYALPDARIDFSWYATLSEFSASSPGATCTKSLSGHSCALGTIAANSSIPITVRVRADAPTSVSINASLVSSAETDYANNYAFLTFPVLQPGDLALSVAQSSVTATAGQRFDFPAIDVNTLTQVDSPYLELQFDPARVQNPQIPEAWCIWTGQPVRCDLGGVSFPGTRRLNLSFVPQGAGPVPITLRVGGYNDFNTANDQQVVTVTIEAAAPPAPPPPPPPPAPSTGNGGGGGSMDWLLAALLALLWYERRRTASALH